MTVSKHSDKIWSLDQLVSIEYGRKTFRGYDNDVVVIDSFSTKGWRMAFKNVSNYNTQSQVSIFMVESNRKALLNQTDELKKR